MFKLNTVGSSNYLVVSESKGPATVPYLHPTATDAFREAERLSRQLGGKFYVLRVEGFSVKSDVFTQRFDYPLEPPF